MSVINISRHANFAKVTLEDNTFALIDSIDNLNFNVRKTTSLSLDNSFFVGSVYAKSSVELNKKLNELLKPHIQSIK